MKKCIFLILIFLLVGCYDYRELNDIAIVKGASIDILNNEYILNYAITNSSKENDTTILKGKGKTISEAISDMNLASSKEIYIGHLSILIISEDVAKLGITNVTDYFFKNPLSKKTFQIAISKNYDAEEILRTLSPLNEFSTDNISKKLTNEDSFSSFVINTTLLSFFKAIKDPGIEPVINGITIKKDSNDKSYTKIETLALFKDDKFIKWTNKNVSKGLSILYNQSSSTKINAACKNGNINFLLNNIKIQKKFFSDNKLTLKIYAKTKIEEMTCNYNLNNKEDLNILEKILINKLKDILNQSILEIKKSNIDSIGIGLYIYQNNYHKYLLLENDYLDKIKINFEIKPNLLTQEIANGGTLNG